MARALLGKVLVRMLDDGTRLEGVIVETEAYLGTADRAAHTFGGHRSARNEAMYAIGGTAYVYFTYGMHHCVNVVAGRADEPIACLVRAVEPMAGIERMRELRAGRIAADRLRTRDLCSGPAKLTEAMAIDRSLDGIDLVTDERLCVRRGRRIGAASVAAARRVGVAYAGAWAKRRLRFYVAGNPHVSVVERTSRRRSR